MVEKFIKKKRYTMSARIREIELKTTVNWHFSLEKNSIIYQNILFLLIMHAFVPAEDRRGQASVSGPTWELGLETH